MNHKLPPEHECVKLTRRDALIRTLAGGLAAALPTTVFAKSAIAPVKEPDFVSENDYPFFGCEPKADT